LAPDVLRGIAILGILPMNMQIFAMVPAAVIYPYAGEHTDPANIAAWTLTRVFIGSKDLSIFSMLFGAGILMAAASRTAGRAEPASLHYRRMAVLLVFGLCHAYLIWAGDILVTYALCGSLVYLLRDLSAKKLVLLGAAAYAVPMSLLLAAHFLLPHMPGSLVEGVSAMLKPSAGEILKFNSIYGGGWGAQMQLRVSDALFNQTINVLLCMGWVAGGMMLIGMGLYKMGILTAHREERAYRRMIAAAALIGFAVLIYSLIWSFARSWRLEDGFFFGWFLRESAYPIIDLGWIGAVMLVCMHRKLPGVTGTLSAVGRVALSNYLLQSVICSFIFYGHGLGLVGKVDHIGIVVITLGIWAGQLAGSSWWVRRFRFGPAEWLWRSLVYGEWQAMRCSPRLAV
jgi:uncharacterized protein